MKQGKRKNRKNSCFTEIRNRDKNSSIRWMDLTRVNYKFQGARYRSGSRNRIIPLVRDKLYAKPELKYRRYEFQTGQQIPPSPVALSTRNNPTIWSVTGEDGRRYLIQPSNTAAEWKLLNHAPGFWPERVPFRSLPSPADFQPGVIGIFPPCCPPDLTYLEHAPLLHLHPARPRNIIAQIFARDARPRSKTIGGSVVISASSRYTASASLLPIQLFALPTPRVGIQRINLWLLPAECLPRRASWIIITRRVSCDGSQLHSLKTTTGVNKIYLAVSARAWKSGENLQIAI